MNIPEVREKIKLLQERLNSKELYTVLLILLVGFASFGLGRLSKLQESHLPIKVEQAFSAQGASAVFSSTSAPFQRGSTDLSRVSPRESARGRGSEVEEVPPLVPGGKLIASKGGTKYHFPWCSGAQRISEANKIWFNSVEDARKAGYTPASNCKGLK